MIRDDIKAALVTAMKGGDKDSVGTIRLIQSAIKNRDIELRTAAQQPDDDALVTEVLQKMIKQRRESVDMYTQGGRAELAAKEEAEIAVIERFLPQQMSEDEARAAIAAIIADTGASSMKDMGKVMAEVKSRHATSIEPAKASQLVKAALANA
ncbi:GatB/YqeY domain-containing protein [Sphingomonas jaspsi]|uniref:GatB/YqeY domain-containing protein n=1 Tax=Sphingomonas jaspsi TaxID=392409 RepID=UPI0004B74230|nr:GatB/YqeY domain-containing protein [Sphingomonas jaspsi]